MPFRLDAGIAHRARIGLIVLATDHTIEHEFRQILRLDGVALYESRIANAAQINATTLAEMERGLSAAAAVILPYAWWFTGQDFRLLAMLRREVGGDPTDS